MDVKTVEEITALHRRGATILFGRGHRGEARIKVRHGPLGLLTRRYRPDEETYQAVKAYLRDRTHVDH